MLFKLARFFYKKRFVGIILLSCILITYYFILPKNLFSLPYSTVLFDKDGQLLGAKIASDGQWRFPPADSVPDKFAKALITFEDKRFYNHHGVDLLALARAIRSNLQKRKRISGGSTLSMQTIRLSRKNPRRTIMEKAWEIILATRMEWSYSKDSILNMYISNAPFGGNVVGLDAAAWKYFGRAAHQLSWAETAMLAVLPNSPSLIHLNKNRDQLKRKRNRLLEQLKVAGYIDSLSCELAKLEKLPDRPKPLARLAPHLLERARKELVDAKHPKSALIRSTLDANLQEQMNSIVERHSRQMQNNKIFNAAALVVDVETGNVLSYIGNSPNAGHNHGGDVDIITAARSSGSILKPILMAAMLQDGELLPQTLYPDIPSHFGGYVPKNYDETYSGAVAVNKVISRSLNIPTVHMLQQYGINRFYNKLKELGMSTLKKPANHYGLTLILGGAETTVEDLAQIYGGMARSLGNFGYYNSRYAPNSFKKINFLKKNTTPKLSSSDPSLRAYSPLQAAAIWHSFEAMQAVDRPDIESYWENFVSASRIAWKTGTSFGFRDAWAVGITPKHLVVVWVGNADGEGRPGLVGVKAAGPLLFDIFHLLGHSRQWFEMPLDELVQLGCCSKSGHLAGPKCEQVDSLWAPLAGQYTKICPYHQTINLSLDMQYQLHSDCASPSQMQPTNFFILPPTQALYYKKKHPSYVVVPPFRPDCKNSLHEEVDKISLIYPLKNMKIYVPKDLMGGVGKTVFEAAHSDPKSTIFWHLDNQYIGSTKEIHQLELNPAVGTHRITIVDENGSQISCTFEILARES